MHTEFTRVADACRLWSWVWFKQPVFHPSPQTRPQKETLFPSKQAWIGVNAAVYGIVPTYKQTNTISVDECCNNNNDFLKSVFNA